jgi:hypothetical protein
MQVMAVAVAVAVAIMVAGVVGAAGVAIMVGVVAGVVAGVTMVVVVVAAGVVALLLAATWPSACNRPWGSSRLPLLACLSSRARWAAGWLDGSLHCRVRHAEMVQYLQGYCSAAD